MTAFERVKQLCKEKGITMKKLEQEIGVSQNLSYRWKNTNPSAENLFKLAEYFGVSTDYILTGEDDGVSRDSYYDEETEMIAKELQKNKELRAIFDVAKGMSKERLDAFYNLLKELE